MNVDIVESFLFQKRGNLHNKGAGYIPIELNLVFLLRFSHPVVPSLRGFQTMNLVHHIEGVLLEVSYCYAKLRSIC